MTARDQIELHTRVLRRWHGEKKARRLAVRYVESGQAWKWTDEATGVHLQRELFA